MDEEGIGGWVIDMRRSRQLSYAEVGRLSSRKGVKKVAVENFLLTISEFNDYRDACMNLEYDSRLYNWNMGTVNAIQDGIDQYFGMEI